MNAEGIYSGGLVEGGMEELGKNKYPCMYLTYEITHISDGKDWTPLERPMRRDVKLWLSETAYDNTYDILESMGWNYDFDRPVFANENVNNAILECAHEEYKGNTNDRWYLNEYKGFSRQALPKEVLRKLNARMNTRKATATKPAAATPPALVPPSGKDIPF